MAFPKHVLDMLLKQDSLGDLIALYMFYLYTSAWQGTNRPKATTRYAARGLRWTEIDHSMEADTPNAYHGEFFT